MYKQYASYYTAFKIYTLCLLKFLILKVWYHRYHLVRMNCKRTHINKMTGCLFQCITATALHWAI